LMSSVLELGVRKHCDHYGLALTMAMHDFARSACKLLLSELPWKEADSLGPARHGSIQSWHSVQDCITSQTVRDVLESKFDHAGQ
jgi:hypothetical protein